MPFTTASPLLTLIPNPLNRAHVASNIASIQARLEYCLQLSSNSLVAQMQAHFTTYATSHDAEALTD